MNNYQVIYADPPWSYENKRTGGSMTSGAEAQYTTMTLDEIKAMPIDRMTAKNAVLFMWVVVPLLPECLEVLPEWGFKYKTMITWHKTGRKGLGYWLRGQTEHLVLAVKGNVKAFRYQGPNHYSLPVGKHSEKHPFFRELINELVVNSFECPEKLELFARDRNTLFGNYGEYDGWDLFGNQVENSIKLVA